MKKFDDLTEKQQAAAEQHFLGILLEHVVSGAVRFNDEMNQDDLQARIDMALDHAERNQTPWFGGEYILEVAREDLEGMARCDAEDAIYLETGEVSCRVPEVKEDEDIHPVGC